jgi:hypothetical protein
MNRHPCNRLSEILQLSVLHRHSVNRSATQLRSGQSMATDVSPFRPLAINPRSQPIFLDHGVRKRMAVRTDPAPASKQVHRNLATACQ